MDSCYLLFNFLKGDVSWPSRSETEDFIRRGADYGFDSAKVKDLSLRCGVPAQAGGVDMASVLEGSRPELALQVRHPSRILLRKSVRPKILKRPFVRIGREYLDLVRKCAASKLVDLVSEKQIWRHEDRPLYAGAFAVAKDAVEDRFILAAVPVNQLIDRAKLPRPAFAYIPKLRSVRTTRGKRVVMFKRDARHYFFQLALHPRWRKYLSMPPVRDECGVQWWPRQCVAPMGFAPSAGWAHAVTEVCAKRGGLPSDRQVEFGKPPPTALPVWGGDPR